MKILIDCIYTNDVGHCASSAKMRTLVEYVLALRDDIFFYWLIPDWTTEEEALWLPKHKNIKYILFPYNKDRLKEYIRFYRELEQLIAFNGICWDTDIVITNRTSMVPTMKATMNKVGREGLSWAKKVFLIEDMPIMTYKKLIPMAEGKSQDIATLAGYITADMTAISSFWQKEEIIRLGKDYLAAQQLRYIHHSMVESTSVQVLETGLKKKVHIEELLNKTRPFTIAYVGRMTASQTRIPEILSVMEKNWILKSGKSKNIRCLVSTVSQNTGRVSYNGVTGLPDWVEFHRPSREGFWKLFTEEVDVYIFMSKEEDYSMSLMEPLIRGCPAILIRDKWSVGTVGEDYPFFVSGVSDAYVLVKAFHDDYPTQYKKFAEWSRTKFKQLLIGRNEDYICFVLMRMIEKWEKEFGIERKHGILRGNEIVGLVNEHCGDEFVFDDAIRKLHEMKLLDHLAGKLGVDIRDQNRLVFGTDWNVFRLGLMANCGFVDAGVEVGHMKRGTAIEDSGEVT